MEKEKSIQELLNFCIVNLNKPSGPTSFKACDKVRKILGAKKAGHFGTLDPMVTGVLPIALNRGTRLSHYFMGHDKEYIGKMNLHLDVSEQRLKDIMNDFIGVIIQKPPVRSRVKRVDRERLIKKFNIIKKDGRIVEFSSDVQAGTYIRKLIHDLGKKLNGAHMTELKRIRAGIFKIEDSFTLDEIYDAYNDYKKGDEKKLRKILISGNIVKRIITYVSVKEESLKDLLNGKPLMKSDVFKKLPNSELISVFLKEKFIGIYKRVEDGDIIAKPEFVLN
ncbi:RNA-guided pseudouridylation complex pseudouridine synthase subunit Cbf5 [Candidatus Pacearchaeota archaeon]|nr:RNA-guided pseudouridylation complex pseudouridine synthase subunit Cbf5 [Candidatus Pacearchaeota archaeon]